MVIYHVCFGYVEHLHLIEPFLQERFPGKEMHWLRHFLQAVAQWLSWIRQASWNDQQDLKVILIYRVENHWRASVPCKTTAPIWDSQHDLSRHCRVKLFFWLTNVEYLGKWERNTFSYPFTKKQKKKRKCTCMRWLTILLKPDSVMSNTTVSGIPGSFFAYRSSQKATYFFLSNTVFGSLTCSFTLNQTK